jgi:AcrR family transcriptional regulator
MEEKESDILESARKIFLRYGIRSVTMEKDPLQICGR